MKRIFSLIAIIAFLSIGFASAQLLQPIKARDGKATATSTVASSFPNAKLMAVATVAGSFDFNGIPITITFNEPMGTADAWVYFFHNASPDTSMTVGVAKTALGMMALPIDPSKFGVQFPFQPTIPLDNYHWMNSDSMMLVIENNTNFITFKTNNPDQLLRMTACAVEPIQSTPVWGAVFESKNGSLNCFVNATTGETQCTNISDINVTAGLGIKIYPNPASDLAILNIRTEYGIHDLSISICNINGNVIRNINNPMLDANGSLALNLSSFPPGVYLLNCVIDGMMTSQKLVVIK